MILHSPTTPPPSVVYLMDGTAVVPTADWVNVSGPNIAPLVAAGWTPTKDMQGLPEDGRLRFDLKQQSGLLPTIM